jgi:hypothetical protein
MTTIVSDTSARERIARIIDPDAWHETLRTDGCGEYWMGRRAKALAKADAILASLPSPEGEWQPIASAPKDGTRIDIWAHWPEHDRRERTTDAYWNGRCWQLGQYNEMQFVHRPAATHWRPLPAPPAMLSATPSSDGERGK